MSLGCKIYILRAFLKLQLYPLIRVMNYFFFANFLNLFSALTAPVLASSSRFQRLPQSQSVVEDEPVDFECESTDSYSELQYDWLHNGEHCFTLTYPMDVH